ncbi:MAG: DUF4893 domain-containing protein [Sphingomonadaceae bacterium]|nr:DUF4893 domain-containing protein [Sphingomonadaceae bacterium]
MPKRALVLLLAAATTLSACAYNTGVTGQQAGSNPEQRFPTDWRRIVTEEDRVRLREWRGAFTEGLAEARAAGHGGEIDALGMLLAPDAALVDPRPPAGTYRCRMIKLGSQRSGLLDYVAYDWFECQIADDGEVARFAKTTGSQRPVGSLYPDSRVRMVFLGTLELSDEVRPYAYDADPERDMIGAVERIGEARWRIVFPWPAFESTVDVLELVPAG